MHPEPSMAVFGLSPCVTVEQTKRCDTIANVGKSWDHVSSTTPTERLTQVGFRRSLLLDRSRAVYE